VGLLAVLVPNAADSQTLQANDNVGQVIVSFSIRPCSLPITTL